MDIGIYLPSLGCHSNKLVYKQVRVITLYIHTYVSYYTVVLVLEESLFVERHGFVTANSHWTDSIFYGRLKWISCCLTAF